MALAGDCILRWGLVFSGSFVTRLGTTSLRHPLQSSRIARYSTLETARHIRLVDLHPGSNSQPLKCSLHHVSLDSLPKYEALSYVWGNPAVRTRVDCEEVELNITANLHAALLRLRRQDLVRTFWVDSICINQKDVAERNHQVALMKNIYQGASKVVVWLGEEDVQTDRAFQTLHQLYDTQTLGPGSLRLEKQEWESLAALTERPWFRRMWVIQEVALNVNVEVCCGSYLLPWETLYMALHQKFELGFYLSEGTRGDMDIKFIGDTQLFVQKAPAHSWLNLRFLAEISRSRLCSDPKDKIYALLGLANDANSLSPDYAQSVEDVFVSVARCIIKNTADLKLLTNIQGLNLENGLPSWVPDWRSNLIGTPISTSLDEARYHFNASRSAHYILFETHDLRKLALSGVVGDSILEIIDIPLSQEKEPSDSFSTKYHAWSSLVQTTFPSGEYPWLNEPLVESFHRTLVADLLPQSGRLSPQNIKVSWPGSSELLDTENLNCFDIWNSEKWVFMTNLAKGRTMVVTKAGFLGLVPGTARKGDLICILFGSEVPFVLRPTGGIEGEYFLVGECYIHGLMNGGGLLLAAAGGKLEPPSRDERSRMLRNDPTGIKIGDLRPRITSDILLQKEYLMGNGKHELIPVKPRKFVLV